MSWAEGDIRGDKGGWEERRRKAKIGEERRDIKRKKMKGGRKRGREEMEKISREARL